MKMVKKKVAYCIVVLILFTSLFFAACSASPVQETVQATDAPVTVVEESTATPIPEPTATETPVVTAAPTEVPAIPCMIAFDTDRDQNREIYIMEPDGKNPLNLTNNPADDRNPVWSPDGAKIAFASNRSNEQGGGQAIFVMDANGNNIFQLSTGGDSGYPDWSNDGSAITYTSNDDIYVIKSDGSNEAANLTNSPEKDTKPKWSPDNSQILFLSGEENNWNLFVMSADGSHVSQLTDDGKVTGAVWTVDGQIFAQWDNQEAGCQNCVMNADGTNISSGDGKGEMQKYVPFWTLDGERVELVNGDINADNFEIVLVGEVFPDFFLNLTNNPADDRNPDWPANCVSGSHTPLTETNNTPQVAQTINPGEMVIGYEGEPNQQREADLKKACTELQIQCVKGKDIPDLVQQGVDAIVSFSNQWKVQGDSPAIWSAVEESKIPVIVLNADSDRSVAYNLSADLISVRASLEWMFEEMGGQGNFVYYNFGDNGLYRSVFESVLKEYPAIKATSMPASWETDSINEKDITALVESDPTLGAIWANNEVSDVFWGVTAVQSDKLPSLLCLAREDSFENWKNKVAENPALKCYASIQPGGTGYEGVYVAYYILTGEKINPDALGGEFGNTFLYDYPVVTNENLEEWIGKIPELQKGEYDMLELPPMTPEQIKAAWFLE